MDERMLGVNFAEAEDTSVYDGYLSRMDAAYGDLPFSIEGTENFYDAAYYTMYAMAAAGDSAPLAGIDVAAGMRSVVDLDGEEVADVMSYDPDSERSWAIRPACRASSRSGW